MWLKNYNYRNIRVRLNKKTGQMFVSVVDNIEENIYRETLVSTGKEFVYKLETDGLDSRYLYQGENGEFSERLDDIEVVLDFKQVVNHLFGSDFKPYSRYSVEELINYEKKLNETKFELFEDVFSFRVGKAPLIKNFNSSIIMGGRPCEIKFGNSVVKAYEFKTIDGKHTFVQIETENGTELYRCKSFGRYEKLDDVEIYPDMLASSWHLDRLNAQGTKNFKEFTIEALLFNVQHSKRPQDAGLNAEFGN